MTHPAGTDTAQAKPATTLAAPVVIPALAVVAGLLVYCVVYRQEALALFSGAEDWVTGHFDWFYILSVTGFLVFLVLMAASRFGDIRLGPDTARPEYSFVSWIAMLFAAGMGIGLMYFGVGEPMQHYVAPATQVAGTPAAAREAMLSTFFHWGFHAWSVYGVMGLVLAYFGFRYNLPLTLRSGLYPVLRNGINGWIGHVIDAFALIGTIAGIATTLGYGVLQLSAGLHQVFGWETSSTVFRVGLIIVVMGLAGTSAATGVDKGVRILSELNLTIAIILMLFVVICGPTTHLLLAFSENVGNYLSSLVALSFRTFAYQPTATPGWFASWTIQYWAWWISWSPFVGMFIAKISRGRTIREFVIGVLLVPATFNLIWMTAFGNTAIWIDSHQAMGDLSRSAGQVDALLFHFFDFFPFSTLLSVLAIVLIAVFFVTSADSGALVADIIATRGAAHSPVWQRLFWTVILGLTAAILMLAGGLKALQAMTLVAALPLTIIMLLLCFGLWRGLKADLAHYSQDLAHATSFWSGAHWRKRLAQLVHRSTEEEVRLFMQSKVLSAMQQVSTELQRRDVQAQVIREDTQGEMHLVIPIEGVRDFVYGVRVSSRVLPAFMLAQAKAEDDDDGLVYEPVTFFEDGREGYDIQHLREEEIIADILRQYERYLSLTSDRRTHLLQTAPGHTTH
ncbi:BCCT family transporter [Silvimonas iriomotensis]|uniref:Transporter n=1 Tax=Silvimonas iriomotensis TaxID=449662 RepID=A0ABQ2P5Y7_9NEIS|nr:BCCT family transporter [Silvimonas iriomotensis]GGP18866.1 transporter [Silvimonas iriomotensis]